MKSKAVITVCCMLVFAVLVQAADISFTITLDDSSGKATSLVNDFAVATGWTVNVVNPITGKSSPNPLTKGQHAKKEIEKHIRETIKSYRANKKAGESLTSEIAEAEKDVVFK